MTTTRDTQFTYIPADDRITVEVDGQLLMHNRQELKQAVLDWIERGRRHVVIDLTRCPYIDSSGLGVLVSLSKRSRDANGSMRLTGLNDELYTLFELTGLLPLFHVESAAR